MRRREKTNEYPTVTDLFYLLNRWRHLPGYQLERRTDVLFALFLPEVLKYSGIEIKYPLIPEFPIDKNKEDGRHKQADYFALSESRRKGILIELKTDVASIRIEQLETLLGVASRGSQDLIKDVICLAQNKNNSRLTRGKYAHLLHDLSELNLVELLAAGWVCTKEHSELDVIYILPKRPRPGKVNDFIIENCVRTIYFDEFADAVDGGGEGEVRRLFTCYLREWAANDAGSPDP